MGAVLHDETHRLTVDDINEMLRTGVLADGEPLELLEGRLVAMSPQSTRHPHAVWALRERLASHYGSDRLRAQMTLDMGPTSQPEPDLCVTRESIRTLDTRHRHPTADDCLLVVEVAYTSQRTDRRKAVIYGASGIPTYWLIDVSDDTVTVYTDPGPDGYRSTLHCSFADEIALPGLDAPLVVAAVLA